MENYIIEIEKGKESRIKTENIYKPRTFFHDAYRRAAYCVEDILQDGQQYRKRREEKRQCGFQGGKDTAVEAVNRKLMGYPNNVIAFCAERGQGKTSAMTSFSNALRQMGTMKETDLDWIWERESLGRKCCYEVLESLDPSMMEDSSSIIKMVLSGMFSRAEEQRRIYKQDLETENCQTKEADHNCLLAQFQKCFRDLEVQEQEKQGDMDELEQIAELSDNANMRGTLYRLVKSFLSYLDMGENSYLVIQIDDTDLNIKDAYRIVEDIRRYLVLPRVIILMAVNMRQMESVVQQHFITQYTQSIQNGGIVTAESCRSIAELYLEKVIPGIRRIDLPNVSEAIKQGKENVTVLYAGENGENLLSEGTMEEQLLRMLHRRTGIVFLPAKEYLHNLLPGSLRGLSQFLAYFSSLPEISMDYWKLLQGPSQDSLEQWQSNLNRLETYLMEAWAPVNLTRLGYDLLRSVQSSPDGNKNRRLLWALPEYYAKSRYESAAGRGQSSKSIVDYREEFEAKCEEYGLDIYRSNAYSHASFSDVYSALSVLVSLPEGHSHYKLAYGVRLYYTIRLHQILLKQFLDRAEEDGKEGPGQIRMEKKLQESKEQQVGIVKEVKKEEEVRKAGEQTNPLAAFLGDILYKRDRLGEQAIGVPYGHYVVKTEKLKRLLDLMRQPNTKNWAFELQSRISSLCRWEMKEYDYRTQAVQVTLQKEIEEGPRGEMVFNLFYPCLLALEELKKTSEPSDELLSAMVLLLNCDVQYMLDHTLRHDERYLKRDQGLLRQVFQNVRTYGLNKVLEAAEKITGKHEYIGLFGWFDTYGKLDEKNAQTLENSKSTEICMALVLLQMSVAELHFLAWRQLKRLEMKFSDWCERLDNVIGKELQWENQPEGGKEPAEGKEPPKQIQRLLTDEEKRKKTLSALIDMLSKTSTEMVELQKLVNEADEEFGIPEMECLRALYEGQKTVGTWNLAEMTVEDITARREAYHKILRKMEKAYGDEYQNEAWFADICEQRSKKRTKASSKKSGK